MGRLLPDEKSRGFAPSRLLPFRPSSSSNLDGRPPAAFAAIRARCSQSGPTSVTSIPKLFRCRSELRRARHVHAGDLADRSAAVPPAAVAEMDSHVGSVPDFPRGGDEASSVTGDTTRSPGRATVITGVSIVAVARPVFGPLARDQPMGVRMGHLKEAEDRHAREWRRHPHRNATSGRVGPVLSPASAHRARRRVPGVSRGAGGPGRVGSFASRGTERRVPCRSYHRMPVRIARPEPSRDLRPLIRGRGGDSTRRRGSRFPDFGSLRRRFRGPCSSGSDAARILLIAWSFARHRRSLSGVQPTLGDPRNDGLVLRSGHSQIRSEAPEFGERNILT